jgi:outer membrane immunogenic protein
VFTPSVSETRTGWVAGVGAEFMLNQNWSLKAEYLHYDFGSDNESFVEGEDRTITTDATFINDQVRVGLNYAF